jgi:hypothetical protein
VRDFFLEGPGLVPQGPVLGSFPPPLGATEIPPPRASRRLLAERQNDTSERPSVRFPSSTFFFTILPQDTNRPNIFKFLLLLLSPACRGIAGGSLSLACPPRSTRPAQLHQNGEVQRIYPTSCPSRCSKEILSPCYFSLLLVRVCKRYFISQSIPCTTPLHFPASPRCCSSVIVILLIVHGQLRLSVKIKFKFFPFFLFPLFVPGE